jgi:hypothetical protein
MKELSGHVRKDIQDEVGKFAGKLETFIDLVKNDSEAVIKDAMRPRTAPVTLVDLSFAVKPSQVVPFNGLPTKSEEVDSSTAVNPSQVVPFNGVTTKPEEDLCVTTFTTLPGTTEEAWTALRSVTSAASEGEEPLPPQFKPRRNTLGSEDGLVQRQGRMFRGHTGALSSGSKNPFKNMGRKTLLGCSRISVHSPSLIKGIVRSEYFDYFMGVFLMLNAISIGVQVNFMADHHDEIAPLGFRMISWSFCFIFTCELTLRLTAHGRNLYYMKGWQWNVFDTIVVCFQLVDEFVMLFLTGTDIAEVIKNAGALRMLRLGRIVRLIRMVRLIHELKSMVYLITASMWSFFWTMMLLILMMFCVAVFFTETAGELAKDWKEQGDLGKADAINGLWGGVARSMLSLFQAITGGDDWNNFVAVFEHDSIYIVNTLIFSVYIAFATLVMLNLVTGVFVEGAQRIIKEDKDNELVKTICKLFAMADENDSHDISWTEFEMQLETPQMDTFLQAVDLSKTNAKDLFQLMDLDETGTLTAEEFVRGCMRLKGPARSVDLSGLVHDFDSKSTIMLEELHKVQRRTKESHDKLANSLHKLASKVEFLTRGQPAQRWIRPVDVRDDNEVSSADWVESTLV